MDTIGTSSTSQMWPSLLALQGYCMSPCWASRNSAVNFGVLSASGACDVEGTGNLSSLKTIAKNGFLGVLAVALPGLAGCSMDDIQLNGKVFDAMGMNTTGSVKSGDPKMAGREPLRVHPRLAPV